jgi:hypothetical protein
MGVEMGVGVVFSDGNRQAGLGVSCGVLLSRPRESAFARLDSLET